MTHTRELSAVDMNGLDWIVVVSCVFCLVRGIMRGAVSQVFGIAGLLAGFVLASHFYGGLAARLMESFPEFPAAQPAAFGILFCLTWLCIAILGFWMSRLVRLTGLAFWDRLWGGVLGAGKSALFAMILVSFLAFLLSPQNPVLKGSLVAPYVLEAAQWLIKTAPVSLQKMLEKKQEEMRRYRLDGNRKEKTPDGPRKKEARPV